MTDDGHGQSHDKNTTTKIGLSVIELSTFAVYVLVWMVSKDFYWLHRVTTIKVMQSLEDDRTVNQIVGANAVCLSTLENQLWMRPIFSKWIRQNFQS